MESKDFRPYLIVIGLLVLACFALAVGVDVSLVDTPGIRMALPQELGNWRGRELRYCHSTTCQPEDRRWSGHVDELEIADICPECGSALHTMSKEEYDVLPKDTQFVKSAYTNDAGGRVFVSIVLSGAERGSIHRPQRCLPGQGHKNLVEHDLDVPLETEGRNMGVRVIESDLLGYNNEIAFHSYYAYWFAGLNRETSSHYMRMFWLAWDRVFHSQAHRWAYIAVSGHRDRDSKEYEATVKEFVSLLYPTLQPKEGEGE
ncbi:exosortase-associated EpsI family protein [Verrucomicrobiota bacterium]